MKHIHIILEDKEYKKIKKLKNETWNRYLLNSSEDKKFIKTLEEKVRKLGAPFIDIVHNNKDYYKVEGIINYLINHFLDNKQEVDNK